MNGFCPLASGSKGNCIYIGTYKTRLLIDAGISAKEVTHRLNQIHVSLDDIEAILITHEHSDHIDGLTQLAGRKGIPILTNGETAKAIYDLYGSSFKFKIFSTGETFEFGDLEIHPFTIQHDAVDPVGFTIKIGNFKLGICADLGFASSLVKQQLQGCDYLYVEANHEPSMVHASARPMIYKQRVLSRQGHLSNQQCAELILDILNSKLKHIHLAHLSSECNTQEVALKTVQQALATVSCVPPELSIAFQDQISKPLYF